MLTKIFTPKIVEKVTINVADATKARELEQAKGVMNNYLKDKHFTVRLFDALDADTVVVQGLNEDKTALEWITVLKESDTPFLRKIYQAIENLSGNPSINKKKSIL